MPFGYKPHVVETFIIVYPYKRRRFRHHRDLFIWLWYNLVTRTNENYLRLYEKFYTSSDLPSPGVTHTVHRNPLRSGRDPGDKVRCVIHWSGFTSETSRG